MLKKALTIVLTYDTSSRSAICHIPNITVTLDGAKGILKGQLQDEGVTTSIKSEGFQMGKMKLIIVTGMPGAGKSGIAKAFHDVGIPVIVMGNVIR